jgi:rhamnulokinase
VRVAAVDMGATSVRVAVVDLDAGRPQVEIVHRWFHGPDARPDGSVRWRWQELVENVHAGLDRALAGGPLASIGVDGWGVDYGLLGEDGRLLSDPHSYRSPRTSGWREVAQELGEDELYRRTGIQLMPINTIFQLAAHDQEELGRANQLVMLPELVTYELTSTPTSERSNAGTTGMLDIATGTWAEDLLAAVGVDPAVLPLPEPAGRPVGVYHGAPVHLVAAHDTACAFAASPLGTEDSAFVSAGTWVLVGIERGSPDTSEAARSANFSNEVGALGGYRFLKNVPGFWLLEQCAAHWETSVAELLERSAAVSAAPVFDVHDERLLAPERMDDEIRRIAGISPEADKAVVARSIVESIANAVARVVDELRRWQPVSRLVVVGGGGASSFVRQRFADHAQTAVVAGSTEATALGNALVQGIALGRFDGLESARRWARG